MIKKFIIKFKIIVGSLFKSLNVIFSKIIIFLIEFYHKYISKALGRRCKYYPTCSEYTKQAIIKYGAIKGTCLGLIRILKCNPFSKGGYDPVK